MARPKTNAKKTAISIREGLSGWIEFRGRAHGSMAAYLNHLAAEDRAAVLAAGGDEADRYRAFLVATGQEAELEVVDDGQMQL